MAARSTGPGLAAYARYAAVAQVELLSADIVSPGAVCIALVNIKRVWQAPVAFFALDNNKSTTPTRVYTVHLTLVYRARQLYKNISMLFLFPVKDGKLSTGVNATFNASCYG